MRIIGLMMWASMLAACAPARQETRAEQSPPVIATVASVLPDEPLSAARVVQFALTQHPDVRAELARLDVIEAERVQAGLLRNPMLTLMALRPESGGGLAVEAGWMQSLFDLLTRSRRVAQADAEARRGRAKVAMRLLDLGVAAQSAFHDAVATAARARLLHAELALDEEALALQSRWAQQGLSPHADVLALQSMRDERAHMLHEAEADATRASAMLAERMGLASSEALRLPEDIETVAVPDIVLADAQARALTTRPELEASDAARDAIGHERARERGGLRSSEPELGLRIERDAEGMAMLGPDLRIALPWFDRGQARAARYDALSREALARDEALRRRIVLEVERAWTVLAHALHAAEQAEHHRARVQIADDLSARQYRNGGVDRMARIAARRALIQAERQRLEARAALAGAQVELQRALGSSVR